MEFISNSLFMSFEFFFRCLEIQGLVTMYFYTSMSFKTLKTKTTFDTDKISGVASSISEGDIFIYLCSAQLTSFEIDLISKQINCAEQEYMNMSPSLIELATPLDKISKEIFPIL